MSDATPIEWTDATWQPITGCSILSPGCARCYAMRLAGGRLKNHPSRKGLTKPSKAGPVWTGEVRFNEHWIRQPLEWSKPRMIFVCAHSDLFHEDVPDAWIDQVFAVMAMCPQHTFQVLTKRAARMRRYITRLVQEDDRIEALCDAAVGITGSPCAAHVEDVTLPLPNVWLGVSAERQQEADDRVPELQQTPAAIRFVSAEPLIGPIEFAACFDRLRLRMAMDPADIPNKPWATFEPIDWVVVGGESQHGARPMHPDWARAIRDACTKAGVAFFFKQWGAWAPAPKATATHAIRCDTGHYLEWTHGERGTVDPMWGFVSCVGKKAAGRLLDGREWSEFPRVRTNAPAEPALLEV